MDKIQKNRFKKVTIIVFIVGVIGAIVSLSALLAYQNNIFVTAAKIASETEIYNSLDLQEQPNMYAEFSVKAISVAPEEELANFNQVAKMMLFSQNADEILLQGDELNITLDGKKLEQNSDALSSFLSGNNVDNKDLYNTFGDRFAITKLTQDGSTYLLAKISNSQNWASIEDKITVDYKVYDDVNIVAFSSDNNGDFSELKFSSNVNEQATTDNTTRIKYIEDKGRYGETYSGDGRTGYLTGTVVGVVYYNLDTIKYGEGSFGPLAEEDLGGTLAGIITVTPTKGTAMTLTFKDVSIGGESYPPANYMNNSLTEDSNQISEQSSETTVADVFESITSQGYSYSFVIKDGANLLSQYATTSLFNRAFGTENLINSLGMNIEDPDVQTALGPDTIGFSSGEAWNPSSYSFYARNPDPAMLDGYSKLLEEQRGLVKITGTAPGVHKYSVPASTNSPPPDDAATEQPVTDEVEATAATPSPSATPEVTNTGAAQSMSTEATELDKAATNELLNAINQNCDILGVVDTNYFLFRYFYTGSPAAIATTQNNILGHVGICQRDDMLSLTLINK